MKHALKILSFASLATILFLMSACSGVPASSTGGGTGGGGTTTGPFAIGGTVAGLTGTANPVVIQNNNGDSVTVPANGAFTFKTLLASGTAYSVTVTTQPSNPAEACTITNGNGTASATVTNVTVTCTAGAFVIGGNVTGLQGTGLTLQDNGKDNLTIPVAGGTFTFATPVTANGPYNVTVLSQPTNPAQTCVVTNGSGAATSNVGNVSVTCSTGTIQIGGSVSGYAGGAGFTLLDNGGDSYTVTGNGPFNFATLLPGGANYAITVGTQPTGPGQTCTVTNGTGVANANVNSVQVLCPAVFHNIGGTVVGLLGTGGGLVLQDNGGDNLPITGNGTFTFLTQVANGSPYEVSVFIAPNTQPQEARIYGYKGTATSDVTNVVVDFGHNDWAWVDGSNGSDAYETNSPPSTLPPTSQVTSTPGGVLGGATWTDHNGNLWLFSGYGFTVSTAGTLPEEFEETWMYGSTQGFFGYEGSLSNYWTRMAPPANPPNPIAPPGRDGAITWTDPVTGNLRLFGGQSGPGALLNDIWEYQLTLNNMNNAWVKIDSEPNFGANNNGVYTGPNQYPGSRWGATARLDSNGIVWMFGGFGYDSSSATPGLLNDLWNYNTGTGKWTFVSGSTTANQSGVYGTEGTAAPGNVPGGRQASVSWIDTSNNFWMFGGYDTDASGHQQDLNDLWEYSAGQWTWVSGSNTVNQLGVYGTQGVGAATNVPGARYSGAAWSDLSGNLWLFGGQGFDATGNGSLADLWEFKGGQWIWTKGPSSASQPGVYGIQENPTIWPNYLNNPGSRWAPQYWSAPNNTPPTPYAPYDQFFLMGGQGFDATTTNGNGKLNDLWRYLPNP
jgi:Galactose oxidase, central domain